MTENSWLPEEELDEIDDEPNYKNSGYSKREFLDLTTRAHVAQEHDNIRLGKYAI